MTYEQWEQRIDDQQFCGQDVLDLVQRIESLERIEERARCIDKYFGPSCTNGLALNLRNALADHDRMKEKS